MKLWAFVVALLCALGYNAWVPRAVAQAPAQMQVSLDQMKSNVTLIPASAEKDRWQGNAEMWQVMIGQKGNVPIPKLELLKTYFREMQANVAGITEPEEQERWQANMFMWGVLIRLMESDTPDRFFVHVDGYFGRMQANVAQIVEPSEKGRWQANVDIWKIMIARLDKTPLQDVAEKKSQ